MTPVSAARRGFAPVLTSASRAWAASGGRAAALGDLQRLAQALAAAEGDQRLGVLEPRLGASEDLDRLLVLAEQPQRDALLAGGVEAPGAVDLLVAQVERLRRTPARGERGGEGRCRSR